MFLVDFFKRLNEENVEYLVLRGYQDLPEVYYNDVDFGVSNDQSLCHFFEVLGQLNGQYEFKIIRDVIRHGLVKVILIFEDTQLKLDIFTEYRYAGLEYVNNQELHSNQRILSSGIKVPAINSEVYISLLKELLHNSRIREDKSRLLRDQYNCDEFKDPFLEYFTEGTIESIRVSLFNEENFVFLDVSKRARLDLLQSNIRKFGFFKVVTNCLKFFYIKYFKQSYYDNYIFRRKGR